MKLEQVVRKLIRWGVVFSAGVIILENFLSKGDLPVADSPGYK